MTKQSKHYHYHDSLGALLLIERLTIMCVAAILLWLLCRAPEPPKRSEAKELTFPQELKKASA